MKADGTEKFLNRGRIPAITVYEVHPQDGPTTLLSCFQLANKENSGRRMAEMMMMNTYLAANISCLSVGRDRWSFTKLRPRIVSFASTSVAVYRREFSLIPLEASPPATTPMVAAMFTATLGNKHKLITSKSKIGYFFSMTVCAPESYVFF